MKLGIIVVITFTIASVIASPRKRAHHRTTKKIQNEYVRNKEDILIDAYLTVPELITKYGYVCEVHNITTEDGYILEIHRILPQITTKVKKLPLIFVPGLISSSADWVVLGPGKSLPLLVADIGYDVWLFNGRGNRYALKHQTIDVETHPKQFYNFTYHEIATIDVPTVIDYMLNVTKQEHAIYFGHSQGTTVSYILCSERPEYNTILKAVFNFGPSAYLRHIAPVYHIPASNVKVLEKIVDIINLYDAPLSYLIFPLVNQMCQDGSMLQIVCSESLFYLFGSNPKQMNATQLPLIAAHVPAGTSLKQMFHYLQAIDTGLFRQYDYGPEGNMIQYGQLLPPEYNLDLITAPFYLFYSQNDIVNSEQDVEYLFKQLKNAKKFLIQDPDFNHIDFLFAKDAPKLVFEKAIAILETI